MNVLFAPTILFQAPSEQLAYDAALGFLQIQLCSVGHNPNTISSFPCMAPDCRKLKQEQHHAAFWIKPSKQQYVLEDLQLIFHTIHFARTQDSPCFFIIEQAHLLPPACANKLLKTLEEPAEGYHFLLLSSQPHKLLPTIASRCVVKSYDGIQEVSTHPLLTFFYPHPRLNEPFEFEQIFKKNVLGNLESNELAHELCAAFITEKNNVIRNNKSITQQRTIYINNAINLLQQKLLMPPAQGSGDLFWKNLYLQFPHEQ